MFRLMYIRRLEYKVSSVPTEMYISIDIVYQGLLIFSAVPCFNQTQLVSKISKCIIYRRRGRVVFWISSLGQVESNARVSFFRADTQCC